MLHLKKSIWSRFKRNTFPKYNDNEKIYFKGYQAEKFWNTKDLKKVVNRVNMMVQVGNLDFKVNNEKSCYLKKWFRVTLKLVKPISINSEINLGKNNLILNFQFINSKISLVNS